MPKFGQNLLFWPNIDIFGPFGPMADQKTMRTRCLGGVSVTWVPKLLLSPVRNRIFCPKTAKFWPEIGIFGHLGPGLASSNDALLVGWLVVVARGLYLARHLFTL